MKKRFFLREIWEFRESNENTLFRNFYWKLFFQFLSKFSFNLRKKLSSFGRRFLFVYWSNSKMTGRNSNPTIERKTVDFRLSLPISLKIPIHFSNSLFRAVEKGHVSQSHTWKPGWRFCGRAKGNSKALDALSRVSAWVPITNNIFQPHRIGHFAPGQKVPKPLFLYFFCEEIEVMRH